MKVPSQQSVRQSVLSVKKQPMIRSVFGPKKNLLVQIRYATTDLIKDVQKNLMECRSEAMLIMQAMEEHKNSKKIEAAKWKYAKQYLKKKKRKKGIKAKEDVSGQDIRKNFRGDLKDIKKKYDEYEEKLKKIGKKISEANKHGERRLMKQAKDIQEELHKLQDFNTLINTAVANPDGVPTSNLKKSFDDIIRIHGRKAHYAGLATLWINKRQKYLDEEGEYKKKLSELEKEIRKHIDGFDLNNA